MACESDNMKGRLRALSGIVIVFFLTTFYLYGQTEIGTSPIPMTKLHSNKLNVCTKKNIKDKRSLKVTGEILRMLYTPSKISETHITEIQLTDRGIKLMKSLRDVAFCNSSGEEAFNRLIEIRKRCKNFPLTRKIDLSRMVYDDQHKVVMCVVPKNACTTWKRYMWYLMGKVKNKEERDQITLEELSLGNSRSNTPTLESLPPEEAIKRLLTYTTFFVARDPFERLVSAHNSKFSLMNGVTKYMAGYGKKIALSQSDYYLNGLTYYKTRNRFILDQNEAFQKLSKAEQLNALEYIKEMNVGNVSFSHLARHIIEWRGGTNSYDVHWRPQVNLCNPCVMDYDHVIRFENLGKDSNVLLEYLQKNDPKSKKLFFDVYNSYVNNEKTRKAFSELDRTQTNKLRKLYHKDFQLLGYPIPDW